MWPFKVKIHEYIIYLLLTFTFALVDLSNLLNRPRFDDPCSSVPQVFNHFHHVLHSKGFVCKLVNMIVSLFVEEICVVREVVMTIFGGHKFFKKIGDCRILEILTVITWGPTWPLVGGRDGRNIGMRSRRIWGLP